MTYIASQFPVVEITLENDQLAFFQILQHFRRRMRHPPVTPGMRPESTGAEDELAFAVQLAPVLEEEFQICNLLSSQRLR